MADNTIIPQPGVGSGGDTIRDIARQGGAVKTQVVALDLGGTSAYPENLINAGQDVMAQSVPVVLASDQPSDPVLIKIADLLSQLLPANPGMGTPSPFEQLTASIRSILQEMSPWQVQTTAANVAASPFPPGAVPVSGNSSVQSNAVASAFLNAPIGKTVYVTCIFATGLGATAAAMATVQVFNIVGGTWTIPYAVPAGVGVAAPFTPLTFNPPLVATGPNVNIQINLSAFGSGNVGEQVSAYGYAV